MPLLNYTTSIEAAKTIMEIHKILASHGATAILTNYDADGVIESLSFIIKTPWGERPIRLPVDADAILKVMTRQGIARYYRTKPQAVRVAWRIIKDWLLAQMAILDAEMVRMEQIFLPYVVAKDNKTIYQLFADKGGILLTEGKGDKKTAGH